MEDMIVITGILLFVMLIVLCCGCRDKKKQESPENQEDQESSENFVDQNATNPPPYSEATAPVPTVNPVGYPANPVGYVMNPVGYPTNTVGYLATPVGYPVNHMGYLVSPVNPPGPAPVVSEVHARPERQAKVGAQTATKGPKPKAAKGQTAEKRKN